MKEVIRRIVELHTDNGERDEEQLEVVFSNKRKIIVEAPAGYGKTKTMVSKIISLVSFGMVPNPKKVLALTFSVNAASKIRGELAEQIPLTLSGSSMSPLQVEKRVFATNYHGFCRRVLNLYGYLMDPHLEQMNALQGVDDSRGSELARLDIDLTDADVDYLVKYGEAAKKAGEELTAKDSQGRNRLYLHKNCHSYLKKVRELFLPRGYIPFNAILLFVHELFSEHIKVRDFYRSYFPVVLIDEFQDTNTLQWTLLQDLIGRGEEISRDTHLIFFGDSLQRIYGFIGAIRGVMRLAQDEYDMHRITLKTNHRFRDNEQLLYLDENIRRNAKKPRVPSIRTPVHIEVLQADDQEGEALAVVNLIKGQLQQESDVQIAVLMRVGGTNNNTKKLLDVFEYCLDDDFSYFYALYGDEDDEYIEFHESCLGKLQKIISSGKQISFRRACSNLVAHTRNAYPDSSDIFSSLVTLLKVFLGYVIKEYTFLTVEEKVELVRDTLERRALKQFLGRVETRVILSTVHGAKGLEWDYVIVPDMEQFSFPFYLSLCQMCPFKKGTCQLDFQRQFYDRELFERHFYQELSTFYVAATRAKRGVFFSYSRTGLNARGSRRSNNLSCFLQLRGIEVSLQAPDGA